MAREASGGSRRRCRCGDGGVDQVDGEAAAEGPLGVEVSPPVEAHEARWMWVCEMVGS